MHETYYHLPVFDTLLSHFPGRPLAVRDTIDDDRAWRPADAAGQSDDMAEMLMLARLRSGDYFATLATELDKMAQALNTVRAPEAPELERLVSELLYLDENFRLTRK